MRRGLKVGRTTIILFVLSWIPVAAAKERLPNPKEAIAVAAAWLRSVAARDAMEVERLSTYPFRARGFETPACKGDRTAENAPGLQSIVSCAYDEFVTEGTEGDLAKDDLAVMDGKTIGRSGWKEHRSHLRVLMQKERLVWRIYPDEDILHVVVLGVRSTASGPKVASISYHSDTLSE